RVGRGSGPSRGWRVVLGSDGASPYREHPGLLPLDKTSPPGLRTFFWVIRKSASNLETSIAEDGHGYFSGRQIFQRLRPIGIFPNRNGDQSGDSMTAQQVDVLDLFF